MTTADPPPQSPKKPDAITCDEAFELIRVFTAEELGKAKTLRLRAHLSRCPECMARYRDAVSTAASLGRVNHEQREKRAIERQRHELHAKAFGTEDSGVRPTRRNRFFQLRLVLIPAIFIYIMTQVVGLGPPPAKVQLVESKGLVSIDERSIEAGSDPSLVLPGRWVKTRRLARARLEGTTCTIDLESSTDLLVESANPPRFRFRSGGIRLEGTTTLVTVLGMIEVEEGKGRLFLDDRGLSVQPESGRWARIDMAGETILKNGRDTVLRP